MQLSLLPSLRLTALCVLVLHSCIAQTVVSTLSYNFTLAAVNTTSRTTLPNVDTTGAPLVLGQNGRCPAPEDCISSNKIPPRCHYRNVLIRHIGKLLLPFTVQLLTPQTDICILPVQRLPCTSFSQQLLESLYEDWRLDYKRDSDVQRCTSTLGHQFILHQSSRNRLWCCAEH